MKYIFVVCVVFAVIIKSHSYVVTSTKDVEITTSVSLQNHAHTLSPAVNKSENKQDPFKHFTRDKNYIYLDDVIFALTHQNWTEDEVPCLNQTLRLLYNLQNSTLWAVWDWDSTSSEPEGILYGNRYHIGNFDECMNAPWYKTHPDLRTQYCLAEIVLERNDKKSAKKTQDIFDPYGSALNYIESTSKFNRPLNRVTWGACVPAVCSPGSVVRLLEILLARSYVGAAGLRARITVNEECQKIDEPREYNGLFYAFLGTMGTLLAIVLICTYINRKSKKITNEPSLSEEIVGAFCLRENFNDLFKVKKDGVEVLYGVRFLSMCVIVIGHQYGMFNGGPVTNGFQVDKDSRTILGMLFLHDDIVVDSFFFLSGFLTARGMALVKRLPNILIVFLKRYVRLVVAYGVIIFYVCAVFPYTGSGPLWNRAVAAETDPCLKNWWLSLLMVNNYIDSENMCIIISWYIPCDFHFYVITILLYYVYKRFPGFGSVCAIIVAIAAIVVPGIINYVYKLPAIQLFTYEFKGVSAGMYWLHEATNSVLRSSNALVTSNNIGTLTSVSVVMECSSQAKKTMADRYSYINKERFLTNPRSQPQFNISYIKSHNRYAAYLIGFLSGYLFTSMSLTGNLNRISKGWASLGSCLSIVIMVLMILSGPALVWANYGLVVDAIYAALNRPLWALSLTLLVSCCSLGNVPVIKKFLSWYPWVPLSRLAYGLYITHALIIARNVQITRSPQHTDYIILMNSTAGVIFWGCIASLAIWLVAEAPINNLLMICLKPRKMQVDGDSDNNVNRCRPSEAVDNKGYLTDNITPNSCYSSKI